MSTNIPNNRTPRTPRTPQQQQITDPSSPSEHQVARHISGSSRHNSTASTRLNMDTRSRSGSAISTRRSARIGSRCASAPGGVVGLPGSLDEFLDTNFPEADAGLYDDIMNTISYDTAGLIAFPTSTDYQNTNQFEDIYLDEDYFNLNFPNGLGLAVPPATNEQQGQNNNQIEAGHAQPDLVPVRNYADFSTWIDLPVPTQSLNTTPGLSAIPGGNSIMPQLPVAKEQYPDPSDLSYMAEPYFSQPTQEYVGHISIDSLLNHPQEDVSQETVSANRESSHGKDDSITKPRQTVSASCKCSHGEDHSTAKRKSKRKQIQSSSDSEDEAPVVKRRQQVQPENDFGSPKSDVSRRNSSSNSLLDQPVNLTVLRAGEKPKKCGEKAWVRINNSTKGETTRTARINQFTVEGNKYKVKPLPVGNWETGKFKFEYVDTNGMHVFKKGAMSARQIHEYITEYPGEHLRIWIQVTPGDAARRYATKTHSHCLFEQCPNRKWAHRGTIEVGNYRVAFDEKHKKYGKGVVDPFDCVGYAHLYCMERFLDFAGICETADVKVDTRGDMKKEPKGEAAFIFAKKHLAEKMLAEKFIRAARVGKLDRTPEFSNYPVHKDYKKGEPKPHEQTLVSAMFKINWDHRPRSQLKQFVFRNILPTSCGIHRGDQEIIVVDKKVESLPVFKEAKDENRDFGFDHSAYYDRFHPEINIRRAECLALRARFKAEDAAGTASGRPSRKRKMVFDHESDDEEHNSMPKSRSSPRKQQRVNYEPQSMTEQEHNFYPPITGYAQAYHTPHTPLPQPQGGYDSNNVRGSSVSPLRKASCSEFFKDGGSRYEMPSRPDGSEDINNVRALTDEELEALLSLSRRKSSTLSSGPSSRRKSIMRVDPFSSIMKSPNLNLISRGNSGRTASFNLQPVTSSKEYNVDDPPFRVAGNDDYQQARRSARLASITISPGNKTATGRVDKRHHK